MRVELIRRPREYWPSTDSALLEPLESQGGRPGEVPKRAPERGKTSWIDAHVHPKCKTPVKAQEPETEPAGIVCEGNDARKKGKSGMQYKTVLRRRGTKYAKAGCLREPESIPPLSKTKHWTKRRPWQ